MSQWFRTYGFADIFDNLLIGAYPLDAEDVSMLRRMGVKQVMNLVEDGEYKPGARDAVGLALERSRIPESRICLTDFGDLPAEAFEEAVQQVLTSLDQGRRTYVHCRAGWQRSAAVAAGVVAVRSGMEIDDAVDFVRSRKPSADPLPHQREDLRTWWAGRGGPGDSPPAKRATDAGEPSSRPAVELRDASRGTPRG
jgi:protein-tyrosine phosphatase